MIVSTTLRSAASGAPSRCRGRQGAGVDGPFHGEAGAEDADFAVAAGGGFVGDDLGDVQAGDRVGLAVAFEGQVGGVVGADEEVGSGGGEAFGAFAQDGADGVVIPDSQCGMERDSGIRSRVTSGCS